jgi:hypothetical protein
LPYFRIFIFLAHSAHILRGTMEAKIENNELVIRIPIHQPRPSQSGKTLLVASTGGNVQTTATVNGCPLFIGVNAYLRKRDAEVVPAQLA